MRKESSLRAGNSFNTTIIIIKPPCHRLSLSHQLSSAVWKLDLVQEPRNLLSVWLLALCCSSQPASQPGPQQLDDESLSQWCVIDYKIRTRKKPGRWRRRWRGIVSSYNLNRVKIANWNQMESKVERVKVELSWVESKIGNEMIEII